MSKLTGSDLEKAVQLLEAADVALEEWLEDEDLSYADLPNKHRQMLERVVIAVLHYRDGEDFRAEQIAKNDGLVERQSGSPATVLGRTEVELMRRLLLQRVANLKSTNKAERGTPNEVSHDAGWQGALELMEEAIKEVMK